MESRYGPSSKAVWVNVLAFKQQVAANVTKSQWKFTSSTLDEMPWRLIPKVMSAIRRSSSCFYARAGLEIMPG